MSGLRFVAQVIADLIGVILFIGIPLALLVLAGSFIGGAG